MLVSLAGDEASAKAPAKGENIMPATKVHKNTNYTVMSNYHLQDKNLKLKAKGLLSYVLSLPEN